MKNIYLKKLLNILKNNKNICNYYSINAGEENKNIKTITKLWTACLKNKLDRNSIIIAFGGGVVGDMAGFIASTYLRGIDFIQIPTTLLAQVDASIGGKTGFDLDCGKNLIGTFYQAKLVWIDFNFLKTLDDREFKNGLYEVIKYALIYKNCGYKDNFFEFIKLNIDKILNRDSDILEKLIKISGDLKNNIVRQDNKEKNIRKILNLGHTLGHSLETYQNYKGLKHGEGVGFGIMFAINLSLSLMLCEKNIEIEVLNLLKKLGFSYSIFDFDKENIIENIFNFMINDKKRFNLEIDFILPINLGEVDIYKIETKIIKKELENFLIKIKEVN